MEDFITIVLVFVALTSGSYRMDEQFHPSTRIKSPQYMRLPTTLKSVFFFKDMNTRKTFLTVAVIQQCIAYCYLILNFILLVIFEGSIDKNTIIDINNIYILTDGVLIIALGLFYKFYK